MTTATSRRAFLALGVAVAGGLVLPDRATSAATRTLTVGGLQLDVPAEVQPMSPVDVTGGAGWQWRGTRAGATGAPAMVVLARGDLDSTDATEVLGLLLAGGVAGGLPGLSTEGRRTRTMPGGGQQVRLDVGYDAATGTRYRGTLLVGVRERPPAGVVAVLGDASLTAGELSNVLDSVRWAS